MYRTALLALALLFILANDAFAITTISAGNHLLNPNQSGQVVPVLISDDAQGPNVPGLPLGNVWAIDLYLHVGDGIEGPIVTDIDLIGPGTIFHGQNIGQFTITPGGMFDTPGRTPSAWTSTSIGPLPENTVPANGIVAFVTFDTLGIAPGTYAFSLNSPLAGPTDTGFFDFLPTLIDGTVTIVPEPTSAVLGLFGAAALSAIAIRQRSRRVAT